MCDRLLELPNENENLVRHWKAKNDVRIFFLIQNLIRTYITGHSPSFVTAVPAL